MSKRPRTNLRPIRHEGPRIKRNQQCPCGSGKKAKHCCLRKIQALAAIPPEMRQGAIAAAILQKPIGFYDTVEVIDPEPFNLAGCQVTIINSISEPANESPQDA